MSVYAKCNDQSFNDTATNGIVSFKQLGPGALPNSISLRAPTCRYKDKHSMFYHIWKQIKKNQTEE